MKPSLTLVILTHNSVPLLKPHLSAYQKWVDQIIFVDNNSVDDINTLAKKYGAVIINRQLDNDFAAQRNSAFSKIRSEWSFFLDSDEYVPPKLWREIHTLIQSGEFEALRVPRKDVFLGKLLKYGETGHISLLRLAKTKVGKNAWQRPVHEIWNVPTTNIGQTTHSLEHSPHPNISRFLSKLHWYASLEPHSRKPYSRVHIWCEMIFFPLAKFLQNYLWRQGWRDGIPGLIHALLMSYYSLITRIYLYEAWHA